MYFGMLESGHVFAKSKRAHRVATNNAIKYPLDSEVLALEKTKEIGEIPQIMENGGRFNTLDSVHRRYFLSQAFIHKEGDIFFKDPDDNRKMKAVALFQNDGASMTADKSAIFAGEKFIRTCYGSDICSQKYFKDPSLCIDLALLDGKEDLTLIHSMSKIFSGGIRKVVDTT